jgi:hypothetical protein
MNVANSVLWRMAIILKANKVNLFVYSVLFVSWYYSPNFLDTPRIILTLCPYITLDNVYGNKNVQQINVERESISLRVYRTIQEEHSFV